MSKTKYLTFVEALQRIFDKDLDNDDGNEIDIIVISPDLAEAIHEKDGTAYQEKDGITYQEMTMIFYPAMLLAKLKCA